MTDDLIQDLELQIRWVENHLFPGWQNVVQRAIDRLQPVEPKPSRVQREATPWQ